MKINSQDKKGNNVTIEIEEEYSALKPHQAEAYKEAAREIQIPGFRKGKVPPHILKTHLNEEAVIDKALQKLISDIYPKIIAETNIEPIDYPNIEMVKLEKDQPVIFKLKVDVYPEVKIGKYTSIKVKKQSVEVTDKEVDEAIAAVRNNLATVNKVTDRGARAGDIVSIDIRSEIGGEAVPQLTGKQVKMEMGRGQISPDFDAQLMDLKAGEARQFDLVIPEKFFVPELAGKEVSFNVTVKEILDRVLPPLDDNFAKMVSKSNTIDDMRSELKTHIAEDKKRFSEQALQDSAVEQAAEFVEVDIPSAMIERETDIMIDDFNRRLGRNGSNLDSYLKSVKKTVEGLREEFKEASVKRTKGKLFLRKIVEVEKIEVEPAEVEKELEEMSKASGKSVDDMKKEIKEDGMEAVKDYLLRKKAVDHLVSKIKIEE
ncbi:trigger factor [Candidatus Margulisiibacteriota bacterium]